MIKYKLTYRGIEKVEVEKETQHFVYINGRRDAKRCDWQSYYDTLSDAKQRVISDQNAIIASAYKKIKEAELLIEKTQKITEDYFNEQTNN
jgi:hypothetical protein